MSFVRGWRCDRISKKAIAGLVVILIAGSASIGVKAEQGVMLDVRNAKLGDVVMMLTQQSGANISISPDVADKPVTAHFDGLPLDKVLDYVVKTAGVDYWKTEDGTYIIGTRKPESEIKAPIAAVPVAAMTAPETRPAMHTEVVKLVSLHPNDIMAAIGLISDSNDGSQFRNPNSRLKYEGNLGVLDEDAAGVGIHVPGTSPRPNEQIGGLRTEPTPPMIDSGNRSDSAVGRSADSSTGAGQTTYPRPGATGTTGGRTATPTANSTNGTGNLLPEGVDMVMPFPTDNSLIVRGTDDGIAAFKELVHLLDVPPKQVSIKAEFVEVSTSDIRSLGVDWSLERLNTTINTNFNPTGNVIVGFTSGNLAASLRAELTRSSGRIINSPIISTINNEYAEISIGSVIPYWTSVIINNGTAGNTTSSVVNSLTIQTYLRVLPRVNADGTIMLTLMPSVQDTGRIFKDPTGNSEIPETRFQTLSTRRRVMNGETIVVGGFIRKDESLNTTEIPLLGRLPIIGPLFRSTSRNGQDRELLIFVTPTIIGDRSAGSAVGVGPSL